MRNALVLLAVFGLITFVGCGKKDAGAKQDEKAAAEKTEGAEKPGKPEAAAETKEEAKKPEAAAETKEEAKKPEAAAETKAPTGTAGKLVGKWKIDIPALLKTNPAMQKQIDAKPEAKAMMEGMMGSMSFEFTADTLVAGMGGKTNKATYKVKSSEGSKLLLETKAEGKDITEDISVTFTDDNHVVMEKIGDQMKLTLVRN